MPGVSTELVSETASFCLSGFVLIMDIELGAPYSDKFQVTAAVQVSSYNSEMFWARDRVWR